MAAVGVSSIIVQGGLVRVVVRRLGERRAALTGLVFGSLGFLGYALAPSGALFLASVVATQWPGAEGAMPTYYQVVEMLALLVVAATGAGRFAGLDFFVEAARLRLFPPQQATQGKLA